MITRKWLPLSSFANRVLPYAVHMKLGIGNITEMETTVYKVILFRNNFEMIYEAEFFMFLFTISLHNWVYYNLRISHYYYWKMPQRTKTFWGEGRLKSFILSYILLFWVSLYLLFSKRITLNNSPLMYTNLYLLP